MKEAEDQKLQLVDKMFKAITSDTYRLHNISIPFHAAGFAAELCAKVACEEIDRLTKEIQGLKKEIDLFKVGLITDEYATDVLINLFTDKFTRRQKFVALSALEKDKPRFIQLVKEHQPMFYNSSHPIDGEIIMSFAIIEALNKHQALTPKSGE